MRRPALLFVAALLVGAATPASAAEAPAQAAARVATARAEAAREFQAGRPDAAFELLKPILADKTLDRRLRFSAAYLLSRLIERSGRLDRLADVNANLMAMDAEAHEPYRTSGPLMGHNLALYYLTVHKPDDAFRISAQWLNTISPLNEDRDEAGLYLALLADSAKALGTLNRWQDAEFVLERGIAALAVNGAADPADVFAFAEAVAFNRMTAGLADDARHIFAGLYRRAEQGLPASSPDRIRVALWYGYTLADSGAAAQSTKLLSGVIAAAEANPGLPAQWRELAVLVTGFNQVALAAYDDAERTLGGLDGAETAYYRTLADALKTEIALLRRDASLRPRLGAIARRFAANPGADPSQAAYTLYIAALAEDQAGHGAEARRLVAAALDRLGERDLRQAEAGSTHVVPPTVVERRIFEQSLRMVMGGDEAQAVKLDGERERLAFDIVQRLARHRAALGVSAASVRAGAASALDRELLRGWELLDTRRRGLVDELTVTIAEREHGRTIAAASPRDRLRSIAQLALYHDKLLKMRASLAERLPGYLTATRFAHAGLGDFRAALRSGEAAVFLVSYGKTVLSACVRDEGLWLSRGTTPKRDIVASIESLRRDLSDTRRPDRERDAHYDGAAAYGLYHALFGGVTPCFTDASHVIEVLDADLMLLPTAALYTAPPANGDLATAPWFVRKHAVSLLPSAAALVLVRTGRPPSAARQLFLGFGAPDLSGAGKAGGVIDVSGLFATRGGINLAELRQLGALPETADELKALGKALHATADHIHIGADATERTLRRESLADFGIIDFATHGLLAREIDGLNEPAIVLTPGDGRNRLDDGLLTTTDIGELQLDAELVILSACNTAGSDGRDDARGLTGLANAFFAAGARSLIATQWSVDSAATRDMMIGMIGAAARPDGRGIAYALQDAMLKMIATPGPRAHPRFWAPFVVAGDGRALAASRAPAPAPRGTEIVRDWQIVEGGPRFDQAVQIEPAADGTLLVSGVDGLGATARWAGTFRWRVAPDGRILSRRSIDDLAFARGAIALPGGDVIRFGTMFSAGRNTDTVIYRERPDGTRAWSSVESSPYFDLPGVLLRAPDGAILAAVTRIKPERATAGSDAVVLLELDAAGRLLRRLEIAPRLCDPLGRDCETLTGTPLGDGPTQFRVVGGWFGRDGRLRLALTVTSIVRPVAGNGSGIDPVSGHVTSCILTYRTAVWEIDGDLATVRKSTVHERRWTELAVPQPDASVWLAGFAYRGCDEDGQLFAAALDDAGGLIGPISDGTALTETADTVALSPRGEILVAGTVSVPVEVARSNDATAEPAIGAERAESVATDGAALLMLYGSDRRLVASLSVPGRRFVRVRDVRFLDANRFVVAGTIDGGQIWIASYHIERPAR